MRWVKDNLTLVFIVLVAVLAFVAGIILRRSDRPLLAGLKQDLKLEKEVIDARAKAAKEAAKASHAVAVKTIMEEHAARLETLREEEKAKIEELKDDPEELVDFLLRAST